MYRERDNYPNRTNFQRSNFTTKSLCPSQYPAVHFLLLHNFFFIFPPAAPKAQTFLSEQKKKHFGKSCIWRPSNRTQCAQSHHSQILLVCLLIQPVCSLRWFLWGEEEELNKHFGNETYADKASVAPQPRPRLQQKIKR